MSAEKVAHTPGPWRVSPTNDCVIEIEKHGNIALVNLARMSAADARLIAAAPDLLALAKRYASECAWCSGTGTIEHVPFDNGVSSTSKCIQCADIRAVIEKAEGGA